MHPVLIQGSKTNNYSKLEEVLRKSSSSDLESGVTMASEVIDKHEVDAKLYLLRAKLSFKLVRRPGVQIPTYTLYLIPMLHSLPSHSFVEE